MGKIRLIIAAIAVSLLLALAGSLEAQCNAPQIRENDTLEMVTLSPQWAAMETCNAGACQFTKGAAREMQAGQHTLGIYTAVNDTHTAKIKIISLCDTVKMDTCLQIGGHGYDGRGYWHSFTFELYSISTLLISCDGIDSIHVQAIPAISTPIQLPTQYILSVACPTVSIDRPEIPLTYIDLNGKIHTEQPVGFSYCPETRRKYWKFY